MKKLILLLIIATFFVACESTKKDYNENTSLPVKVIESLQTDTIPNFVSYKYVYESNDYYFDEDKKLMYVQYNSKDYIHFGLVILFMGCYGIIVAIIVNIIRDNS